MAKVKHNPQAPVLIDHLIADLPPFSKEIMTELRHLVHKAIPEVIEDWKWGANFYYEGMICGIGAFKQHVALVFFRGALLKDPKKLLIHSGSAVQLRTVKLKSIKELDRKAVLDLLRQAAEINKKGIKISRPATTIVDIPADVKTALSKNKLLKDFGQMSYTKRKDYITWITGAKLQATREKRIFSMIEKVGRGEGLNDKYMK